jgi:GxxExxY protein
VVSAWDVFVKSIHHRDTENTKSHGATEDDLCGAIIGAAIDVHRELGSGLLESIYESALVIELADRGLATERQVEVPIQYKGRALDGRLRLDLLVADRVIIEVKSTDRLNEIHRAQLLSYLRLASRRFGLLINFNVPRLREGIRRLVNGF